MREPVCILDSPTPADHSEMDRLDGIIDILRGENGCPWDRRQTPRDMVRYLIEEAHELLAAIETDDAVAIREEMGDVLFQILFVARMYREEGRLDLESAARTSREKMIRRHPHVFGEESAEDAEAVRRRWHRIKMAEKGNRARESALDGVPDSMPALMRSYRIAERAARTGFDWDDMAGVMEKVEEEWAELKLALAEAEGDERRREIAALEFGDLLFTLANVARFARIHPETALTAATRKFEVRFRHMEAAVVRLGKRLEDLSPAEFDELWETAKRETAGG
jgi:tetrapyrrole methylase family protein / MazG family protein